MTFLDDDDDRVAPGSTGHLARYWWIYALVAVVAVVAVVVPVVSGDDDEEEQPAAGTASTAAPAAEGPWRPGSGDLVHGSGTTGGGVACEEGTSQVAGVGYSVPCLPAFEGDNGGETARGVSADTVRIVVRRFPSSANQQTVDQAARDAGFATRDDSKAIAYQWLEHFNEHYELYGRRVELVEYESEFGDGTAEALGGGREGACADATKIAEELDAFGVISQPVADAGSTSGVFADCARQEGLVVFDGAPYYTEEYFAERDPYVWSIVMECERIGFQDAEYMGKRLLGRPAAHAKGDLQGKPRVLGTYVPDNPYYTRCIDIANDELERTYDAPRNMVVTYQLDVSRFAEQAQRAVVQFKDAGVTSVVLACDPISVIFLTQAAKAQDYFPEWISIGVAGTDTDNFARQYEQSVVEGSLFGMSQLGSTAKIYGPDSEANRLYQEVFGETLPRGTTGWFSALVHVFNLVQAAGPDLTAENLAAGVTTLPDLGAPDFAYGRWSFASGPDGVNGTDHTAVDDSREVYWDADAVSLADGEPGTWVETEGGQRFANGEWPEGEPAVFGAAPGGE
ncbi:MAG TPA: hypothetical protein VM262_11395 [Acidimicrobiales bacterium]|nr:hypothetical protein [Acidimicrobiales bacterium]